MWNIADPSEVISKLLHETDEEIRNEATSNFILQFNHDAYQSNDSLSNMGFYALKAYLDKDVDGFCIALTGWSIKALMARAGIIQDDEEVTLI